MNAVGAGASNIAILMGAVHVGVKIMKNMAWNRKNMGMNTKKNLNKETCLLN